LAGLRKRSGDFEAAAATFRQALALAQAAFGPEHVETANVQHNLALVLVELGDDEAALPLFEEAFAGRGAAMPNDQTEVVDSLAGVAAALRELGRHDQALDRHREVLARRQRGAGDNAPATLLAQQRLVYSLCDNREFDEAEALANDLQVRCRANPALPASHRTLGELAQASVFRHRGAPERAEPLLRIARAAAPATTDAWFGAAMDFLLGKCLAECQRPNDAEPLLRAAFEQRRSLRGAAHRRTVEARQALAEVLRALGRDTEATGLEPKR
jgi:serine/threonine-protein kinase